MYILKFRFSDGLGLVPWPASESSLRRRILLENKGIHCWPGILQIPVIRSRCTELDLARLCYFATSILPEMPSRGLLSDSGKMSSIPTWVGFVYLAYRVLETVSYGFNIPQ